MSRKTATVDFLCLKLAFISWSRMITWSVVLRCFLNPACSGPMMLFFFTNQLRRFVISLSKSLPIHDVRLIGRYELTVSAGLSGLSKGMTMADFQAVGTNSLA